MKAFSRVLHWLAYSVILSLMPVGINYLSATVFAYDFSFPDALSDLLITNFCLAATVLRDMVEGRDMLLKRMIVFLMLIVCCVCAVFFGHIMRLIGLGKEIAPSVLNTLVRYVYALLTATILVGILTQILTKERGGNSHV